VVASLTWTPATALGAGPYIPACLPPPIPGVDPESEGGCDRSGHTCLSHFDLAMEAWQPQACFGGKAAHLDFRTGPAADCVRRKKEADSLWTTPSCTPAQSGRFASGVDGELASSIITTPSGSTWALFSMTECHLDLAVHIWPGLLITGARENAIAFRLAGMTSPRDRARPDPDDIHVMSEKRPG